MNIDDIRTCIATASAELSARKEEINRLNVFPVPDGDTGTNMSLTLAMVVENLAALPIGASNADKRRAITTGALMGARGNSGVITSQILRGLCEGLVDATEYSTETIAHAMARAVEVAFQAVRKPVKGTILTVLEDCAAVAQQAYEEGLDVNTTLHAISDEALASVKRTPELLPVLKENGVVDSGGFGLAILIQSFIAALTGEQAHLASAEDFTHAEAKPSSMCVTGRVRTTCTAPSFSCTATRSTRSRHSSFSRPLETASCLWALTPTSRCTCIRTRRARCLPT